MTCVLLGCGSPEPPAAQKLEFAWSLEQMLSSADIWEKGRSKKGKRNTSQRVRYELVRIDGVRRASILQLPTSSITFRDLRLRGKPRARFFVGVRDSAWVRGGDGVGFSVSVVARGREKKVYQRYLDPANDPEDRGWLRQEVSLAEFSDQRVDVILRTNPGPNHHIRFDQAAWGEPEIVSEATSPDSLPNVILVSFDTLRADHLGAYGHPGAISENVDSLAAAGTVFENCIAQSSWTRPSHLAMLASRYPSWDLLYYDEGGCRVPSGVVTLAETLRANGFLTAAFTGGGYVGESSGFEQGFDYFRTYGRRFETGVHAVFRWLEDHAESRFFLFLHNYNAHTPYDPPEDARERFAPEPPDACRDVSFTATQMKSGRVADCQKAPGATAYQKGLYAAEVFNVDRVFGEVVAELKRLGIFDRTLFVLTSDHGEGLYDHGEPFHVTTIYQELIHVPLILSGPGVPPGVRLGDTVRGLDVAPTVLDLLGLEPPEDFQGRSLAPLLTGSKLPRLHAFSASSWDETLGSAKKWPHNLTAAALLDGKKMIRNIGESVDVAEIYDLHEDPRELSDLDAGGAAWAEELDRAMRAWLRRVPRHSDCQRVDMDPARIEELRALGYLQ